MNLYVRILFSLMLPGFFVLDGILAQHSLLAWSALAAILVLDLLIVWTNSAWWSRTRFALAVGVAISLTLLIHRQNGGNAYDSCILIPLMFLLAKEQGDGRRFIAALALATLVVIVALAPSYSLALWWIVSVVPTYISIRAINVYKEAHRLSQRHLQELASAHHELEQTHAELQEASVQTIRYAALAERTRLARDMHDGIGHQLTSLIVQLQALEIMLPGDPGAAARAVPSMLEGTRAAMSEVRQAVKNWQDDESGLGLVALQGLAAQCAERTHLCLSIQPDNDLSDWPTEVSVTLYRVVQEALTNILRHAVEATAVIIQVQERQRHVILTVADDGSYTADMRLTAGFGINSMKERCCSLGGSCSLSQYQSHGLQVQIILPLTQLAPEALPPTHMPLISEESFPAFAFSDQR